LNKEQAIKITLVHNPQAGKGTQPSRGDLLELLRTAGHEVDYQSSKEKKWHKILKKPGDMVVVAGGDGTVGKVARRLIGSSTPLAILPLGTANNVACTLGLSGRTLKELIAGWKIARCVHFDAGVARGPWGSRHFIEGFGLGLFAETMFQIDGSNKKELGSAEDPKDEINSVLKRLQGRLRRLKSKDLTIRLDGKDLSGNYVLLEALNVRLIGPSLNLAPQADTKDGYLDVVTIPHGKQTMLSQYLSRRIDGENPRLKLPSRRGRHLQIEWESSPVHIDDIRWPCDKQDVRIGSHAITITVDPGALVFLAPPAKGRRTRRI